MARPDSRYGAPVRARASTVRWCERSCGLPHGLARTPSRPTTVKRFQPGAAGMGVGPWSRHAPRPTTPTIGQRRGADGAAGLSRPIRRPGSRYLRARSRTTVADCRTPSVALASLSAFGGADGGRRAHASALRDPARLWREEQSQREEKRLDQDDRGTRRDVEVEAEVEPAHLADTMATARAIRTSRTCPRAAAGRGRRDQHGDDHDDPDRLDADHDRHADEPEQQVVEGPDREADAAAPAGSNEAYSSSFRRSATTSSTTPPSAAIWTMSAKVIPRTLPSR